MHAFLKEKTVKIKRIISVPICLCDLLRKAVLDFLGFNIIWNNIHRRISTPIFNKCDLILKKINNLPFKCAALKMRNTYNDDFNLGVGT